MAAALPLVGIALSVGGGIMNYSAAQRAQQNITNSRNEWLAYQKRQQLDEQTKDEASRKQADDARVQGLNEIAKTPENAANEAARLGVSLNTDNTLTTPGVTPVVNDKLLSGQTSNQASPEFREYAAKTLNKAAAEARARTMALAGVTSVTNSQKGAQRVNTQTLQDTTNNIDLYNNKRRGDLSTYGIARQVQPVTYDPENNGVGDAMAKVGGSLAGGKSF